MPVESTLSEVLLEELAALRPDGLAEPESKLPPVRDDRGQRIDANENSRLRRIYSMAFSRGLSALSLSGGGIRSASFALGIIQGLADKNLLQRFDYLSTVSGGGYIGSWLSAWLYHRDDAERVLEQLRSRRANSDVEPAAIDHLREYSSYLTPKVGLLSADTWTAVAIVFRNMLLNWLILLPAIALPVVVIKILAALVHTAAPVRDRWVIGLVAAVCLVLLSMSLAYKLSQLFSDQSVTDAQTAQRRFILLSLVPTIAAGACFTWLAETLATAANSTWAPLPPSWRSMVVFALIFYAGSLIIYAGGKIIRTGLLLGDLLQGGPVVDGLLGWAVLGSAAFFDFFRNRTRPGWKDVLSWGAAILVFTAVVWSGTRLYIGDSAFAGAPGDIKIPSLAAEIILAVFGIPCFLLATVLGHTTYLMLRSYSPKGDVEREWLG
jgi:hypothetical protein